jgi:hypothetical protein
MSVHLLTTPGLAAPAPPIPEANGNVLDVLMLQVHVACAVLWLVNCVLISLMAVPQLRRIPSPALLHELQVRRELVLGVLWATFVLTLGTGTYLLFKQAIYDPPLSGHDFHVLRDQAYGVPYYYALYAKIALFLVMGAASLILAMEANRTAARSEALGGPVEGEFESPADWLDEEVLPEGAAPLVREERDDVAPVEIGDTLVAAPPVRPRTSVAALWSAVGVLAVGAGGVGFCVTLIKYFHELAHAAVVYEQLRRR